MSFGSEKFNEGQETLGEEETTNPKKPIGDVGIGSMSGEPVVEETDITTEDIELEATPGITDPEGDPGAVSAPKEENNYQNPTSTEDEKPTTLTNKGISSMSGNI